MSARRQHTRVPELTVLPALPPASSPGLWPCQLALTSHWPRLACPYRPESAVGSPCVCGALGPTNANLLRCYSKGLMASRRAKHLANIKLWFLVTCVCIFREHQV